MDMDGSEPLAIQGMSTLIKKSPGIRIIAEYEPGNLKRYLNNPLDFITVIEESGLKVEAILDPVKGRLPKFDYTILEKLSNNDYVDLLFTTV